MLTFSIEWLRLLHDHNNGRTLCEFTNLRCMLQSRRMLSSQASQ
ncbi:hypothetical protein BVRB_7g158130 [Beta vulgaris subsp. vulgaris]|nr:hypothetical protein BVRB_7g158130 [Beta vulgaris subsp. vulgaris]